MENSVRIWCRTRLNNNRQWRQTASPEASLITGSEVYHLFLTLIVLHIHSSP